MLILSLKTVCACHASLVPLLISLGEPMRALLWRVASSPLSTVISMQAPCAVRGEERAEVIPKVAELPVKTDGWGQRVDLD